MVYVELSHAAAVYPEQDEITAQNGEQPIRLPNGLLYPRVEVVQRTHPGDEIGLEGHQFEGVRLFWAMPFFY